MPPVPLLAVTCFRAFSMFQMSKISSSLKKKTSCRRWSLSDAWAGSTPLMFYFQIPAYPHMSSALMRFACCSFHRRIIIRSFRVGIGAFSPCRLYISVLIVLCSTRLLLIWQHYPQQKSNTVSVRNRLLPPASFRFHLAAAPLG